MLGFFRNNQSTTVFLLTVYIAILRLPAILGWVPPVDTDAEAGGLLFHDVLGWALGNSTWSAIGAAVLVLVQALLVNNLADAYRLMPDRNWLPGVLYGLVASAVPDFLFLSPTLLAVTFLPIALLNIFRIYKQSMAFGSVFNSAFWITLAALFHPPAVLCLPAAFAALFNLRSFSFREQLVFLTGILSPVFLALTGYFWFDQTSVFLQVQFGNWVDWPSISLPDNLYGNLKVALLGALLLVSILGFNVYYFKRLIQVQKYITIFYWFMFAGLIACLFHREIQPEYFLLVMPSVSIFLSYLFQSTRNTFMIELFHFALFVVVLGLQLFPH